MAKKKRATVDLSEKDHELLDTLVERLERNSKVDVIRRAIRLIDEVSRDGLGTGCTITVKGVNGKNDKIIFL